MTHHQRVHSFLFNFALEAAGATRARDDSIGSGGRNDVQPHKAARRRNLLQNAPPLVIQPNSRRANSPTDSFFLNHSQPP